MAIAKVRIAPMEQWCYWYYVPKGKEHIAARIVGQPVFINTATMRPANCDAKARMWDATDESWDRLHLISGAKISDDDPARGICEHMLEMD